MRNQAMLRKLQAREAIDVSDCERTIAGDYILTAFIEDKDYCDAQEEEWIRSICRLNRPLPSVMADNTRRELPAGTYLASPTTRFYTGEDAEAFTCVWLR